ncbi:MAG: hypothetical protein FJ096_06420 [Deltaproteobacteria bacterium]|nr:hypothetical protein [Deltaproteobacteria bacterium]
MRTPAASLALVVLLVAPLACDSGEKAAKRCEGSLSRDECETCCRAAGRSGASWVLDDCECHDH